MMRKNNLMKTKTWMLIYKTDTTQDLTVKKKVLPLRTRPHTNACAVKPPSEAHSGELTCGSHKDFELQTGPSSIIWDCRGCGGDNKREQEGKERTDYSSFSNAHGESTMHSFLNKRSTLLILSRS